MTSERLTAIQAGVDQIESMIRDLSVEEKLELVNRIAVGINAACMAIVQGKVDPQAQARVIGLVNGYAGLATASASKALGYPDDSVTEKPSAVLKAIHELDATVRGGLQ